LLADHNIACLYRAQTQGKVRMTTSPQPHEGLGVPQYAWMTSPLRRYCDLVNQWQLLACLKGESPAFAQKSAELFGAMRDFELTYAAYAEFQRLMERYWCLRWVQQRGLQHVAATVRREQLVKLDHLPMQLRIPSIPNDLLPGQRIELEIESIDLLAPEMTCRFVRLLDVPAVAEVLAEDSL
jgi:exoribonuclease-2